MLFIIVLYFIYNETHFSIVLITTKLEKILRGRKLNEKMYYGYMACLNK